MIFGRALGLQRDPPWRAARSGRDQCQIALRAGRRLDRRLRAEMRDIGHDESEMKPRRIPHRGFADGNIGMHRERRLHVSEGRDDDAPDALDGVDRQDAAVTLDQPPHHRGLARRTKRRADLLGLLDLDQPVDDVAARHQQAVDLLVDAVDLLAQYLERGRSGGRFGHLQNLARTHFLILRSGRLAASRRMRAPFSPMVRDGARAPPRHERGSRVRLTKAMP